MSSPSPLWDHRHGDQVWLTDGRESLRPPVGPVGGAGLPDPPAFTTTSSQYRYRGGTSRPSSCGESSIGTPPGRSGQEPRAECRGPLGLDIVGGGRGTPKGPSQWVSFAGVRPSAWRRTGHQGADPAGKGLLIRASLGRSRSWLQGRFFVRPVAKLALLPIRIAGSLSHPCARPSTHSHMLAVRPGHRRRCAAESARSAKDPARRPMVLSCCGWLSPRCCTGHSGVKATGNLNRRSLCSLTASGPARGSPRPCGHP
jgi:hypothetical protein